MSTNKNARIKTRIDRTGKVRTETVYRDSGTDISVSTDVRNNSTKVYFDLAGRDEAFNKRSSDLVLDGREARTLYLALQKHFEVTGKQEQQF